MAGMDVWAKVGPEILKRLLIAFEGTSSAQITKLQQYRNDLINLVAQLTALRNSTALVDKKYDTYFSGYTQYLSDEGTQMLQNLTMTARTATYQAQLDQIITQLLALEHNILSLIDPLTATNTYAIYFDIDGGDGGVLARGEISAKDLYESGALHVKAGGKAGLQLALGRSEALEALRSKGRIQRFETSSIEMEKYSQIAKQAIQDMHDVLDMYEKEWGHLQEEVAKVHAGEVLWNRYQKLKSFFHTTRTGRQHKVEQLYERYMFQSLYGSIRGKDYNRGHLVEAFERWFQKPDSGADPATLLEESRDRLPWYAGGDVNDVQVKGLFTSKDPNQEAEVRIASISSILSLAQNLLEMLFTPEEWRSALKQTIEENLKKPEFNQSNKLTDQRLRELVKQRALAP